jgi:hypothetical protein
METLVETDMKMHRKLFGNPWKLFSCKTSLVKGLLKTMMETIWKPSRVSVFPPLRGKLETLETLFEGWK